MGREKIYWHNIKTDLPSRSFICGNCGENIATEKGFNGFVKNSSNKVRHIYVCNHCSSPTFFENDSKQVPKPKTLIVVEHIENQNIRNLFDEACSSVSAGAYTSCAMCCRKLLMNIAVDQGAEKNLNFKKYVDWLEQNNFIPPNGRDWVDSIRQLGNEANHEIKVRTLNEAKLILKFTEMLLRFIYEMPGLMKLNYNTGIDN